MKITVGVLMTFLVSVELGPLLFFFFLRLLRDLELLALPVSVSVFAFVEALLCVPAAGPALKPTVVGFGILSSVILNLSNVADSLT